MLSKTGKAPTAGAAVGACAGSTGPGVALAASLALAVVATLAVNAWKSNMSLIYCLPPACVSGWDRLRQQQDSSALGVL